MARRESVVLALRCLSGVAGLAVIVGLALPMLPLQEPWVLSGILFAFFCTIATLAFWFCVRGNSERHRSAFAWSAIGAVGFGLFAAVAMHIASPFLWPGEHLVAPVFGFLVAGPVGFFIGALLGPGKLWLRGR